MPPRLLHVFATFAPGGPQVRTARIVAALAGEHRHAVLAVDGRTEAAALLPPGAVELLPPPPRAGSLATAWRMRRLLARERPDLVLTYNWGAIDAATAALSLGLPLLHHEDGFLPDEARGQKRRRAWTRRLVLPRARGVVVPSETLRRIATEVWRLPPARVHLVPNGVRVETFPERDGNPELRRALGIPEQAFLVGSVGSLRREKRFDRLVEAVAALPPEREAWMLLAGDGPERPAVEEAARRSGLGRRLVLAGHREDPRPLYRALDAYAVSSDTEQMPISLVEAMASALPVAATDVGDVRLVLPEEAAPLVVPPDAGALAAALERLAADPALRRRLGAAGRARAAERYAFHRMLAAYRGLYASALAGRVRPGPRAALRLPARRPPS